MTDSPKQQPEKYYFISYSRQEVTFVDSLARELEAHGVHTWLDFRNLIPGHKWQDQLDEGVKNSAAILLVVSKASMKSKPVMDELEKSIKAGRRIVMVLFEPCKIDSRLKDREWVDFTGDFDAAVHQLRALLAQPETKTTASPPEKYVRKKTKRSIIGILLFGLWYPVLTFLFGAGYLPKGVKRFFFLGILAAGLSFLALFSGTSTLNGGSDTVLTYVSIAAIPFIYIPALWNLLQFPIRVRFRRHNAEKLRNSIFGIFAITIIPLLLNVVGFFHAFGLKADGFSFWTGLITLPLCYYLYRVLTSAAFYRWAGPAGILVGPTRPDLTKHLNEDQGDTKVAIEAAPQDQAYALELKDSVLNAKFKYTENLEEANIVLTLLSAYQNRSKCDPEKQYVVPILLQNFNDIDDGDINEFAKVQWIDLRFGKASMDAVANLLDEPNNLLRVLGIIPVRAPILPNGVNLLVAVVSFVLTYSAIWTLMMIITNLTPDSTTHQKVGLGLVDYMSILFVAGLYFFKRYITKRRFWLVKNRMLIFYKHGISDPILSKIIPHMEKRKLFMGFENTLNEKLGRIKFSYPWMLAFAILLAILATYSFWITGGMLYIPVWLIPLLMLLKPVKLWLPAKVK